MLLNPNLSLYRVVKITWKVDLGMLLLCSVTYYVDSELLLDFNMIAAVPTLMGTAIAFFIAFNNNQAYSRWWEARIIWGSLVNNSRSWARNILAYSNSSNHEIGDSFQQKMIYRHIAFLYALKASLRKEQSSDYKKFLSKEDLTKVESFANIPNAILDMQAHDLETLSIQNRIDGFRFLALNKLLRSFCDDMGKSERINNTVFPTTYIYFTRLFIWILVVLITLTISSSIGPWSIFFGWMIGFVFHITHINGMSLMNPFDSSPASIPLNSITRTIEINLLQALGEENIPEPEPTQRNGEYIL